MALNVNIFRALKVADLFTVGNLCCGLLAIFYASNENFTFAVSLIFFALILDTLDGKVAKLMHQQNSFGKQMDSLSDLISFGVAPASVYFSLAKPDTGITLILILFVVCGMLRLARYNISENEGFEGVPITANGIIFPLLYLLYMFQPSSYEIWPAVYAVMSVLMVSTIKIKRIF
ncbi:CDP-diacylglycerol--serine O-phosphatidyltransferase [Nitrosomonas communis]|uniref:CDP-diacylglycerol---serine O-phosphatidyltransferase n=1 Tax=Nitrosomonas communis TaxID=44574 RepID=A0A1H2ZCG5_9PROT|nr:CDP-diacylglycerol--serine O-phosphatidyltransferase [Nitrosomonas communis]SDX14514.1 CDP-diacylglycerol---serine O-phosphatidyltransferase [Nitrosomonas communis]